MSTRPCRILDWPALARICRATLSEFSGPLMSYAFRSYLEDTHVLEREGRLEGYWMANRHHGEGVAWLEQLAVNPSAQGKGHGRALLRDFERTMTEAGFREVQLAVFETSRGAIALYEAEGWERVARPGEKRSYRKALAPSAEPVPGPLRLSFLTRLWRLLAYRTLVR